MFELDGREFTLDQVQEAAQQSGISLDAYIEKAGLKKRELEPGKEMGTAKGATVQQEKAPATESSSVTGSAASKEIADPEPKPRQKEDFYLYNGHKYKTVELKALANVQDVSSSDAFVITTPDDKQSYSYNEVKQAADESGMTVKQYLGRFINNPRYGVSIVPDGLEIQAGIELDPVEVVGKAPEIITEAKKIKKQLKSVPYEDREQFLEVKLRDYNDEQRKVIANLIKEPTEFDTPEAAQRYIETKHKDIEFIANQLEEGKSNFTLKSFNDNLISRVDELKKLGYQFENAKSDNDKRNIALQIRDKQTEYNKFIEENEYSVSKLKNLQELQEGLKDMILDVQEKTGEHQDNEPVNQAIAKSFSLADKAILSIDEGFTGITTAIYAPVVAMFDEEMAKAEGVNQGKRLAKARSNIIQDLTFDQAKENGKLLRYAAEAFSSNAFSSIASVISYSGPQGFIIGPIAFGLSSTGGRYNDLMYQRDIAADQIDDLEGIYNNTEDIDTRNQIKSQINDLEGIREFSDSQIIKGALTSGAIEAGVTLVATKIGKDVFPHLLKKMPAVDKYLTFVDKNKIVEKASGILVGEQIEEHTTNILDAKITDGYILGRDVDLDDVVNLDQALKILVSTAGTSATGASTRIVGAFSNMAQTSRMKLENNNKMKRLQEIKKSLEEIESVGIDQKTEDQLNEVGKLKLEASEILFDVTRNFSSVVANMGNMSDADLKQLFKNSVKQKQLVTEASNVAKIAFDESRKIKDKAAFTRVKELNEQHAKLAAENDKLIDGKGEKPKDISPQEQYMYDYWRSNIGLSKMKSAGFEVGRDRVGKNIVTSLYNKAISKPETITAHEVDAFIDSFVNNDDFKGLKGSDQQAIIKKLSTLNKATNTYSDLIGLVTSNAVSTFVNGKRVSISNSTVSVANILSDQTPEFDKLMSISAPMHEMLHTYSSKNLHLTDSELGDVASELVNDITEKYRNGEISENDYKEIKGRIEGYRKKYHGVYDSQLQKVRDKYGDAAADAFIKSKQNKILFDKVNYGFYEEMLNLYYDLNASGIINDKTLDGSVNLKNIIKKAKNNFAGMVSQVVGVKTKPGVDVKMYLKSFRDFSVNRSEFLTGEQISQDQELTKQSISKLQKLADQWSAGMIDDDTYYRELEKIESEAVIENNRAIEEDEGDDAPKEKQKRPISPEAQKAKTTLDRIGSNESGFDMSDPDTFIAVEKQVSKMIEAKIRNWKTEDNRFVNLEKELDLDIEDFKNQVFVNIHNHIKRFDPEKNDSLYGWINSQIANRIRAVLKKYIEPSVPRVQADLQKNLMADDDFFEKDFLVVDLPEVNLIDPAFIMSEEDSKQIHDNIEKALETSDIDMLRFKTVDNEVANELSIYFGIPADKIIDPKKNLSSGQMRAAQLFIFKNHKEFMKLLPKGAVKEAASDNIINTGTRLPINILRNFYEKSETRVGAPGLFPFSKRNDITKDTFLKAFGMEADGKPVKFIGPRDPEGQTIKAFANMYGKLVTNTKIRQILNERGISPNKIQDIAAGKSDLMLSASGNKDIDKLLADRISDITNQDDKLEIIISTTLKNAGYSDQDVLDTINRFKKILNEGKLRYVGRSKNQSPFDYINDRLFELLSDEKQFKQVSAQLGEDLRIVEDAANKNYKDTRLGKILKLKTIPAMAIALVNEGFDSTESIITIASVFERTFSNNKKTAWFKDNKSVADYLNNTFSKFIKDGKFVTYARTSSGLKEVSTGGMLYFVKDNGTLTKIGGNTAFTSKYAKKHGLKELIEDGDFIPIQTQQMAEAAAIARKNLKIFVSALSKMKEEGNISNKEIAAIVTSMVADPASTINRAGHTEAVLTVPGTNIDDYVFDTRPPASYLGRMIVAFVIDKSLSDNKLFATIDSMGGIWVPKKIYDEAQKLSRNTFQGKYEPGDPGKYDVYDGLSSEKVTVSRNATHGINTSNKEILSSKKQGERSLMEDKMATILSNHDKRVGVTEDVDDSTAKNLAKTRSKKFYLLAPSASDFAIMLSHFLSKGKVGMEQENFFKEKLLQPYNRAMYRLNATRQIVSKVFNAVNKEYRDVAKQLNKKIDDPKSRGFTNDQAIRVYLYTKGGFEVPGIQKETLNFLLNYVSKNERMKEYAAALSTALRVGDQYWIEPGGTTWLVDTIKSDVIRSIESISRGKFLQEWKENKDQIFSKNNLNKIEAAFGTDFKHNLDLILKRMETGRGLPSFESKAFRNLIDWFRSAVATTMFFNVRSAVLQQISMFNYLNFTDNTPFHAAAAFANANEYRKTFAELFHSDFIKERRGGLKTEFEYADLARAMENEKGIKGAIDFLLKKGFLFTQFGDSLAIAIGGTTFYMNRTKTYKKQGMDDASAKKQAFLDFQEISEATQQSSRADKLSNQQTSDIGRVFLAFQNTPMQYVRLMYKAALDLKNGRGNPIEHITKIVYYGAVQNLMFSMLQNFAMLSLFGDDDDEKKDAGKTTRIINNSLDTILRGFGLYGVFVSTAKNAAMRYIKEQDKGWKQDNWYVMQEVLNASPPIGIKFRKTYGVLQNHKFNKKVWKEMGWDDIDNPVYDAIGDASSALLNIPIDRSLYLYRNTTDAFMEEMETWQRIFLALGWSKWNLGIEDDKISDSREKIREREKLQKKKEKKSGWLGSNKKDKKDDKKKNSWIK